ncbi:hypothetical protein ACFYWN_19360 [Streptomyces sp. NPDC002917]|uniref:hypothetical protein n=1 Tax=Streptomyces sp. NPDC002917 TaxID=3364671 RepID=UPI0036A8A1F3
MDDEIAAGFVPLHDGVRVLDLIEVTKTWWTGTGTRPAASVRYPLGMRYGVYGEALVRYGGRRCPGL